LINAKITSGKDVPQKLRSASGLIQSAVDKAVLRLAVKMTAMVKNKLSNDVLRVRSGRLRRSINYKITKDGDTTTASVGTNVVYAKTHEYGLTIPAHIVRARRGKALKFMAGGKMMFRKQVSIPAVKMPERSFLRASLRQMQPEIQTELSKALLNEFKAAMK
jgi:phage gpG-like protein